MPMLRSSDAIILEFLAERVRVLSLSQVEILLGAKDKASASACVKRLASHGFVERYSITARTPTIPRPIASFQVGHAAPDFQGASKALRTRAKGTTFLIPVVRLGPEGARLFGVRCPRRVRLSEASHDLQLAEVAIHYHMEKHTTAWLSEDALIRARAYARVVPDAEVELTTGERLVLECGGSYSAAKLSSFHERIVGQLEGRGVSGYQIV